MSSMTIQSIILQQCFKGDLGIMDEKEFCPMKEMVPILIATSTLTSKNYDGTLRDNADDVVINNNNNS